MKNSVLLLLWLLSCCSRIDHTVVDAPGISYSFFVAGHVYGTPGRLNSGIYPLFKDKFDMINNDTTIQFGIFTGDIVKDGSKEEWEAVKNDINGLSMNVYFAMGNHDIDIKNIFLDRYGNTYYDFIYQDDIYFILDPNIDRWNISGEQLDFLKKELSEIDPAVKNVFVFFHQLLWWSSDNQYKNVKPNSFAGRADSINFWSTVEPLFRQLPCNVIMFAGDVGATNSSADYMYDSYDNITLIASGMGEGIGDNFLVVDVMSEGSVTYRLISLNCMDINCLGKLEDYILP